MFEKIEPYKSFQLPLDSTHTMHVELSGNPNGTPVLLLHGGPGSGISQNQRRQFDATKYHMVQFDQRGCGKSIPHAEIEENTTAHLISDIEALKNHLKISSWHVAGASWGSTLALLYAEEFPSHVQSLTLNGLFLGRREELLWFYQHGAHFIFPDAWEEFIELIPMDKRNQVIETYYKLLTSDDLDLRMKAARAWSKWEGAALKLIPDQDVIAEYESPELALARGRLECHYFTHGCFMHSDNQIIENIEKIRHIPAVIIHGRYDIVCPLKSAWDLKKAWPEAKFILVPDAGHSRMEPGIAKAIFSFTSTLK